MSEILAQFTLDGEKIAFEPGQTILTGGARGGRSTFRISAPIRISRRMARASCARSSSMAATAPPARSRRCAGPGRAQRQRRSSTNCRRTLLQMLFAEGNHFCPGCEKSGNCQLQALAYDLEMLRSAFRAILSRIARSTPRIRTSFLDFNRCIMCELCVRASRDVDGKEVFALAGPRARHAYHREFAERQARRYRLRRSTDKAAHICPVGAILPKEVGFVIADRRADLRPRRRSAKSHSIEGEK